MSLPEAGGLTKGVNGGGPRKRAVQALALAACLVAPFMAGCDGGFRPLYGSVSAVGGSSGALDRLAQVDVTQIPGRVGQQIRNELIFQTTGGAGETKTPTMRLEIAIRESLTSTLVRKDGDVEGQIYGLEAGFNLIRISDNTVLLSGTSYGRASFERFQSVFSNVRAREDAENRAAKTVAEDLKSRLAAFLSKPA